MSRHPRQIWPASYRSVGAMIEHGVIVRAGCSNCRSFFDVDLMAVSDRRGSAFSLIGRSTSCKLTCCRGQSHFAAAFRMNDPLTTLVDGPDPLNLSGLRAIDLEPPIWPGGAAKALFENAA